MAKKLGISLRIDTDKIEELDILAEGTKRNRSFLINEAIDNYLEVNKWQVGHIKAALAEADAGEFASENDIKKSFKKWRI